MQHHYLTRYALALSCLLCFTPFLLGACGNETKVYTVGIYLDNVSQASRIEGLKDGLKAFGYTEGKNLRFEQVTGTDFNNPEQLKAALKDLAAKNYEVYWVNNGTAAETFKQAEIKQPLVVAGFTDPVARGLIQSVERPGTNMTGVDSINNGLTVKRLKWLIRLDPTIRSIYLIFDPKSQSQVGYLSVIRAEANRLGITLLEKPLPSRQESKSILANFNAQEAQAILPIGGAPLAQSADPATLKMVIEREKLILIGTDRSHLEFGALLSYGGAYYALGKQSAIYISKILRGANPADLPVLQADQIELVLNQKLANQQNRQFSELLLSAADDIIK